MSFRIQDEHGDLIDTEPGLQSALDPPSVSPKPKVAGGRLRSPLQIQPRRDAWGLDTTCRCSRSRAPAQLRIRLCIRLFVVQRIRLPDWRLALWSHRDHLVWVCVAEVSTATRSTKLN